MSQFGMQMPGGRQARKPSPDVYTVLMFVSFLMLTAATAFLYVAGSAVGPDGNAFGLQDSDRIRLATP